MVIATSDSCNTLVSLENFAKPSDAGSEHKAQQVQYVQTKLFLPVDEFLDAGDDRHAAAAVGQGHGLYLLDAQLGDHLADRAGPAGARPSGSSRDRADDPCPCAAAERQLAPTDDDMDVFDKM